MAKRAEICELPCGSKFLEAFMRGVCVCVYKHGNTYVCMCTCSIYLIFIYIFQESDIAQTTRGETTLRLSFFPLPAKQVRASTLEVTSHFTEVKSHYDKIHHYFKRLAIQNVLWKCTHTENPKTSVPKFTKVILKSSTVCLVSLNPDDMS